MAPHSCLKEDGEVTIFFSNLVFTILHSDHQHCDNDLQHKLSEIILLSDNDILTRYCDYSNQLMIGEGIQYTW